MISADTNVFVYLHQEGVPSKQATARQVLDLMTKTRASVGLQVVGELQNVVRKKFKRSPVEAAEAGRRLLTYFPTFASTPRAALEGLSQLASGRMSYWDALLVFSAADAGVTTFLSEDMQDGAIISGVRIVNPFDRHGSLTEVARQALVA